MLSNSLANPLKDCVILAGKVENLNLTKNVNEKYLNRKDEVGQLSIAFQSIIEKLKTFIKDTDNSIKVINDINNNVNTQVMDLVSQIEDTSLPLQKNCLQEWRKQQPLFLQLTLLPSR